MIDNDIGEDIHLQKLAHEQEAGADDADEDDKPEESTSREYTKSKNAHTPHRKFGWINYRENWD